MPLEEPPGSRQKPPRYYTLVPNLWHGPLAPVTVKDTHHGAVGINKSLASQVKADYRRFNTRHRAGSPPGRNIAVDRQRRVTLMTIPNAHVPVKQAVISPSALSLLYPAGEIAGYPREQFIQDVLREHEIEVRSCLRKGAHKVQIDFTEGRLAVKIDPSGGLLHSFIDLNNLALARFSAEERKRIGVHTCPGSDLDSTHSGDVDYAELLPSLFELRAGNFY